MILGGTSAVCVLNIAMLVGLMYIYRQGYSELRTKFGLGLLAFAGLLIAQNVLYMYFYMTEWEAFHYTMVYVMTANSVQTLGLAILSWVSWR